MLRWYCVIRHPAGLTPVIGNDERRHWFGLSRVLIERPAPSGPLLIEVRAYLDRRQAETDAIAGAGKAETATLVEVFAWLPFRACLRSLKPAARRTIQLPRPRLAA